LHYLYVDQ